MLRETRITENRTAAGFMRGGKLAPVMAVALKGGESGLVAQDLMVELAPVVGRLITPVTLQVKSVWCPVQAMMALKHPDDPVAGVTEVIRQRMLDGEVLFGIEDEHELSKRMGIIPVQIGGKKKVSVVARLAHNCAVNFLRKSLYTYAREVTALNLNVTPALLSTTAMAMFNGVLNPDDHVNGAVKLDLSKDRVRVAGLRMNTAQRASGTLTGPFDGSSVGPSSGNWAQLYAPTTDQSPYPTVYADMRDVQAGGFSLVDLYNAETIDRLTRMLRDKVDANPIDGEEQVVRFAHGLSMDTGQNCVLVYSTERVLGQDVVEATDALGLENETVQSQLAGRVQFTAPIPRSELGGVLVTFVSVKPDEVLFEQPHPVLSAVWKADNLLAEELELDPVPVLARDLQATMPAEREAEVMFYTGYNELRRSYNTVGWTRNTDVSQLDVKNTMWQYKIPASISPENIVYPAEIDHYPFPDQNADVVRYACSSSMKGISPIFIGPSPVETLEVLKGSDGVIPYEPEEV